MYARNLIGLLTLTLLLASPACGSLFAARPTGGSATPPAPPVRELTPTASTQLRVEVVASRLEVPWAIAFADRLPGADASALGGPYILVTERPGRIRLVTDGQLRPEPVAVLPVARQGEGGLMGLALDPNFSQTGYLYIMYTYRSADGLRNRISRLTLRGYLAGDEQVLLDDIPGGELHDGGRLKFGPDGKLYATTGENTLRRPAQNLDSLAGKVLRLNPDGTVPVDNPFPGSPVYSYGLRNSQGLAWQPSTGLLFATEHGPSQGIDANWCCHDEVNRISPGGNYGWPFVYGVAGDPRYADPVYESDGDTWAPAGATFYEGRLFPAWQGDLFFGSLRGLHLQRLVFGGPNHDQVVAVERLFEGAYGRIRDVAVGPDGSLYFTTSNLDYRWRASPDDDRILRVVPDR